MARAKSEFALKKLVAQGGLKPAEYMRDRRWNRARKEYLIAKQRFEKTRRDDQLRWEREQEWDDAHQRCASQRPQAAAVLPQEPSLCTVCDSMSAPYPTNVPEAQAAEYVAWWEQAGAPTTSHVTMRKTPPKPRAQKRKHAKRVEGNTELREIVQQVRKAVKKQDVLRKAWDARHKTEAAVRRKHNLGPDFEIAAAFWDWPISGFYSRQNHQHIKERDRIAERRARGNKARPRPPRSALSYSETSEELQVEPNFVETLKQREEGEELERQARKVAGQVGYLYFVGGGVNALELWSEDVERSDKDLVVRMAVPDSETSGLNSETSDSEDTEDADEEDHGEQRWDAMDVDEAQDNDKDFYPSR